MEAVAAGREPAADAPTLHSVHEPGPDERSDGAVGGVLRDAEFVGDVPDRRLHRPTDRRAVGEDLERTPRDGPDPPPQLPHPRAGERAAHAALGSSWPSTHRINASKGTRFWFPNHTNGIPRLPPERSHSTVNS